MKAPSQNRQKWTKGSTRDTSLFLPFLSVVVCFCLCQLGEGVPNAFHFLLPYFQVIEPKMKQIPVDQEKLRSYRVTFCYLYTVSVIKYD